MMEKLGKAENLRGLRDTLPEMEEAFGRLRQFILKQSDRSGK